MVKKTYINPNMVVVPFIATHVIANSINTVTVSDLNDGVSNISMGSGEFGGGAADTKSISNPNLWDNEW